MQPAPTFNELYPEWEADIEEHDWRVQLNHSLEFSKLNGLDGSIRQYVDNLISRLFILPMNIIAGYSDYIETIKSYADKDYLTSEESYLLLMFNYKVGLDG